MCRTVEKDCLLKESLHSRTYSKRGYWHRSEQYQASQHSDDGLFQYSILTNRWVICKNKIIKGLGYKVDREYVGN